MFVNPTSCDGKVVEPGTEDAMVSAENANVLATQERLDDYLDIWS